MRFQIALSQQDAHGSAGGVAVKIKAEILIQHGKTLINIFQTDAMPLQFDRECPDLIQSFRLNRRSGIVDDQCQDIVRSLCSNVDLADRVTILHAVMDRIFDQGLQRKVRQRPLFQFPGDSQRKLRTAFITELLDGNIAAGKLYICRRRRVLPGAQGSRRISPRLTIILQAFSRSPALTSQFRVPRVLYKSGG